MDELQDFNLGDTIAIFAEDPAELADGVQFNDADELLNEITDSLAVAPQMINDPTNFKGLCCLLNNFGDISEKSREGLIDIIVSGLSFHVKAAQQATKDGETGIFRELKIYLEQYAFLLHWGLVQIESYLVKNLTSQKPSNPRAKQKEDSFDLLKHALEVIVECLKLNIESILETRSERDLFCGLFLKPTYLFMESEHLIKINTIKMYVFKIICLAIKLQHQQSAVEISLLQLLIYFEHLPEPLAELAQILYEQYDHFQITESIIKELTNKEFNSNDAKGPKVVSTYFVKLSELIPELLLRQLATMVKLLEKESFTLRCGIIEAVGHILINQVDQMDQDDNDPEHSLGHLHGLLELLEERCLDVNPYCRVKSIQMLTQVCELEIKFTKHRPLMTKLAVDAIQDRSSLVRRNGIKFISRLISTHPFGLLHGSQLNLTDWQARLKAIDKEIDQIIPAEKSMRKSMTANESVLDLDDPTMIADAEKEDENLEDAESDDKQDEQTDEAEEENKNAANMNEELLNRLQLTRKYYTEAIDFIIKVHEALQYGQLLLFSKTKNEVIEAMDLFVLADAYDIEPAREGIRKMIRLVWAKANNDEGNAIQSHLITCYQSLFFDSPAGLTENEANLVVSRNIISLTYGASLAELASLEHLLVLAVEREQLVSRGLIKTLWKIYGYPQDISKSQRRGAIILLGMIAKADHTVASAGMDMLLSVGLGERGQQDLGLAKYTCIALQRSVDKDEWKRLPGNGEDPGASNRLPVTHEAIHSLASFLLLSSPEMEWFGVAEQAVKAINDLCATPTIVFSEIIRQKARYVFGDGDEEPDKQSGLAQLLFIVGEVALKTMVYLERCEALFKRAKIAAEGAQLAQKEKEGGNQSKTSAEPEDDLEMVGGGTTEDDFSEAISYIRERELLYSDQSLLTRFGPLVSELCKSGLKNKQTENLSVASTLCLSKLMCVSAQYCEQNIETLLLLMEKSESSTIRSNCVLALGDIAVCFNNIIDENTNALYGRLHDDYLVVQRTCLMTLTFLILAGQVKVKGQLGEMAKCLEDSDKRISELARMFFTELATKDNAIYNGFIDMFSMLTADSGISEDKLHRIFKFLASFIDKDKQIKQLSDKLYTRLDKCETEKSWKDIVYVLSVLPHKNEEIAKTINQGFKYALHVE